MEIKHYTIENDEEFLRQRSKEVDFNDKTYLEDIKLLERYCLRKDNNLLALAAVQIGIPKRIIYIKNTNLEIDQDDNSYNEAKVIINPIIIRREGKTLYWENCLSCGDRMGLVERPYEIELEYQDVDGNIKHKIINGFEATVFSHEYDHLDGILHIDKCEEILKYNQKERKEFRKTHPYEIIRKTRPFKENIS